MHDAEREDDGETARRGARSTARRLLGGVAGGVGLAGYVWVVGPAGVLGALGRADVGLVGVAAAAMAAGIAFLGLALRRVLRTLDRRIGRGYAAVLVLGTLFLNNVTPFGQAGGDPPSGLLLARGVGMRFEAGLAAITSVNLLARTVGLLLGALGVGVIGVRRVAGTRGPAVTAAAASLTVAVVLLAVLGWRARDRVAALLTAVLTPPARVLGAALPRVTAPDRAAVAARIEGFVGAVERIAVDRRGLAVVVGLATLAQLAVGGVLWAALYAVDVGVSPWVPLVVIAIARFAGATPTPGGLAGVEAAMTGLIVLLSGASPATATAAVLVYRGVFFWAPLLPGGVVVGVVSLAD